MVVVRIVAKIEQLWHKFYQGTSRNKRLSLPDGAGWERPDLFRRMQVEGTVWVPVAPPIFGSPS
jgi:hypothetical protein